MPFINERSLEHTSRNGTRFLAPRCDLSGGLVVEKPEGLDERSLAQDIAEFTGWHALCIWNQLNGFAGYDCLQMDIRIVRDDAAQPNFNLSMVAGEFENTDDDSRFWRSQRDAGKALQALTTNAGRPEVPGGKEEGS